MQILALQYASTPQRNALLTHSVKQENFLNLNLKV